MPSRHAKASNAATVYGRFNAKATTDIGGTPGNSQRRIIAIAGQTKIPSHSSREVNRSALDIRLPGRSCTEFQVSAFTRLTPISSREEEGLVANFLAILY